jgi:DNA-directed RNA polymerase specialized sigma subunit
MLVVTILDVMTGSIVEITRKNDVHMSETWRENAKMINDAWMNAHVQHLKQS